MTNLTEHKGPRIISKKEKEMQWNVVEKSNNPLFSLSLQDFAWSEHLELSMSEIESYSCTMVRTRHN